ncbi:MAG TPA: hypothetical protein VES60_05985 [Nakamurella sp.]|jgi:hypothetical protein|nr:hypothetical protein [Nakamurella sp.]
MCLTLANATAVLDHPPCRPNTTGYTRTLHHIGHLSPGDLWWPVEEERPRTVSAVRRHRDGTTVADQQGVVFAYPSASVISTAVRDPLPILERGHGGVRQ